MLAVCVCCAHLERLQMERSCWWESTAGSFPVKTTHPCGISVNPHSPQRSLNTSVSHIETEGGQAGPKHYPWPIFRAEG